MPSAGCEVETGPDDAQRGQWRAAKDRVTQVLAVVRLGEDAKVAGQVALGVGVDREDSPAACGGEASDVGDEAGLANAAFAVESPRV